MKVNYTPDKSQILSVALDCTLSIKNGEVIPCIFLGNNYKEREICQNNGISYKDANMVPVQISVPEYCINDLGNELLPIGTGRNREGRLVHRSVGLQRSILPLQLFYSPFYKNVELHEHDVISITMPGMIKERNTDGKYSAYPCNIYLKCDLYQQDIADEMLKFEQVVDRLVRPPMIEEE